MEWGRAGQSGKRCLGRAWEVPMGARKARPGWEWRRQGTVWRTCGGLKKASLSGARGGRRRAEASSHSASHAHLGL